MVRHIFSFVAMLTGFAGLVCLPAAAQAGTTFYIDYAGGSNANNGTSKSTPWKTHPYMQTSSACTGTGNAPAYSHQAGDQFIFKGGTSWPAACFQMTIRAGGNSTARDYYGVDQSWHSGGSWTRPIFDLAHTVPTGADGRNAVIYISTSFVIIDNLEIKNQEISISNPQLGGTAGITAYGATCGQFTNILITNSYLHDWVTNGTISNTSNLPAYEAGGLIGCGVTMSNTTLDDTNGFAFNSTGNKVSVGFGGACVNCAEVSHSRFVHGQAACFTVPQCHDSEFTGISQTLWDAAVPGGFGLDASHRPHTQVIEDDYGNLTHAAAYNNLIHDNGNVGVTIYLNPTAYIYNNVMWNNANGSIMIGRPGSGYTNTTAQGYVLNNTVECHNNPCFRVDSKGAINNPVSLQNNHWITNGNPLMLSSSVSNLTQSNDLTMSTTTATSQGYTMANQYAPTSSSAKTVGAAANLAVLCSGSVGSALCADRLHDTRPTSWDAGAYQFGGQSSSKPNPPSNLAAEVQ